MRDVVLCLTLMIGIGFLVITPVFGEHIIDPSIVPSSAISSSVGDRNIKLLINRLEFRKTVIGKTDVYWTRRTVNGAIVEGDSIVLQLDNRTHRLLGSVVKWQRTVAAERAPVVSKQTAESMVRGEVQFSLLYYISPDSYVFPIRPTPQDPCWVVRSVEDGAIIVTIIDAVTGEVLGYGVPPPSEAYSLAGTMNYYSCSPEENSFTKYSWAALSSFQAMGYSTTPLPAYLPTRDEIRQQVQDPDVAIFYEVGHSHESSDRFQSGCSGNGIAFTTAGDIESWIADYPKMPFTFLASCSAMCDTGDSTLSYAFRRGSMKDTVTVGFCGMANGPYDSYNCEPCLVSWSSWQDLLFSHMSKGETVSEAFDTALSTFPECTQCVRFTGDPTLRVVPVVRRGGPVDTRITIVTHTPDPSRRYEDVTVIAVVTPNSGTIQPTGSVQFYEGRVPLTRMIPIGTANGETVTKISFASAGIHKITARYSSNNTNFFRDSTSQPATQTVSTELFYQTGTTVTGSPNPSVYGQQVSVQATVVSNIDKDVWNGWDPKNRPPPPTGEVQWEIDGVPQYTTSTVVNGRAIGLVSWLSVGTHRVAATYLGDSRHGTSSGAYRQIVSKANSVITLSSSKTQVVAGEPVIFTIIVAANPPGTGIPTGDIRLSDGRIDLFIGPPDEAGRVTFTSFLQEGTHWIQATYNGDTHFKPGTSNILRLTVKSGSVP